MVTETKKQERTGCKKDGNMAANDNPGVSFYRGFAIDPLNFSLFLFFVMFFLPYFFLSSSIPVFILTDVHALVFLATSDFLAFFFPMDSLFANPCIFLILESDHNRFATEFLLNFFSV